MSIDHDALASEEARPYDALCSRAVAFIQERGGSAHEDQLVGHVFGNTGTLALWRPLLRSVLERDTRVVSYADGRWALAGGTQESSGAPLLDHFVALDVETTGLKASSQRIIEVALVRYQGGIETERFESLVNPGRRIPAYISQLTTITDVHVEDAPQFAEIVERVLEFLDEAILVGHNIRFDLSFLNAELKRIHRAPLVNERIDTMGLSTKLLKNVRKPSLDRVAKAVGLEPRSAHRAGRDAHLTAEVALRLMGEAQRQGVGSLDQLKSTATVTERRPRDDVGRGRALLDRSLLAEIPKKPGVYIMRDQSDHVIYVGKAKNLRDRVSSYYSQPLGYTRKMDGLLETLQRLETEVVGSELEALLLEAQLIRRYQPRYNTALRSFEQYPYIKVDLASPWPRVSVAKRRKDDDAAYFGPYRSSQGAKRTVEAINSVMPLRTCTRSFKSARSYGKPCIQLDLGKCAGPCVGQANRDEYQTMVHEVMAFLGGEDEVLYDRLWAALERAAERRDFERAEKLRRDLTTVLALVHDQQRLKEAERVHNLILVTPSSDPASRELLVILRGRRWAQVRVSRQPALEAADAGAASPEDDAVMRTEMTVDQAEDDVVVRVDTRSQHEAGTDGSFDDVVRRLTASLQRYHACEMPPLDNHTVDESNILNRWLMKYAGHPALIPLTPAAVHEPEVLREAVVMALSRTDEQLVFPHRGMPAGDSQSLDEMTLDDAEPAM